MKAYCQDTCSVDPQLSSKAQPFIDGIGGDRDDLAEVCWNTSSLVSQ